MANNNSLSKKIEYVEKWRKYPKTFFKDVLDMELTPNQIEILDALENNNRIAVKSSNSSGKTHLMGGFVPYYFLMGITSGVSTIVVISAPVFAQIRDGIFAHVKSNLRKANKRLAELFNQPGYKMFPKEPSEDVNRIMYHYNDNSFITGISTDKANAISGRHAERVLTIFDEAQGISNQVFSAFKGIWQSGKIKILAIGNPTLEKGNSGYFYDCFKDSSIYHKITISAFDTPNFLRTGIKLDDYFKPTSDPGNWRNKLDRFAGTDYKKAKKLGTIGKWEDDVKESFKPFTGLQNPISVYDILIEDGRNIDSYEFRTRVLGEFPSSSSNSLYPDEWIQQSIINYNDDSLWLKGEICIGIDTAKGIEGKDLTAFTVSNGNKVLEIIEENIDTRGILNKTKYLWTLYGASVVKIEYQNSGLELSRLMKEDGINAIPVDVSSGVGFPKTNNYYLKQKTEELKKLYHVKRDELYCNIKNELNPNIKSDKPPLLLPPDRELIREMKAITYGKNHKQQIVVCKKDEVRARLGGDKSPNRLDSLLMCRAEVEYDPLESLYVNPSALISIKRPK